MRLFDQLDPNAISLLGTTTIINQSRSTVVAGDKRPVPDGTQKEE